MQKFISTTLVLVIALTLGTFAFAADNKAKRIDINTATEAQLKAAFPGVDAKKIIAGRPYTKKDELKTKNIIGAGEYEKIKKMVDSVC